MGASRHGIAVLLGVVATLAGADCAVAQERSESTAVAVRAADSLARLRASLYRGFVQAPRRPRVVDLPYDSADVLLRHLFITVVARDSFAPQVDRGIVLAQRPPAGTLVRRGDVDTLWVSVGPRSVTVPDVMGEAYRSAVARVYRARLIPRGPTLTAVDSARAIVSRQEPLAPGLAPANSIVRLEVTLDQRVGVPSVVGRDTVIAAAILARARLQRGPVEVGFDAATPPGRVFHQDPARGDSVPPGTRVRLWISVGPEPDAPGVLVPGVVGMGLERARAVLDTARLRVGHVDSVVLDRRAGQVVHQLPHAGDTARAGSDVMLEVAVAAPMSLVPSLIGLNVRQAGDTLTTLGLRLAEVRSARDPTRPDNVVVGQSVPAGSELPHGGSVDVDVNRLPGRVRVPNVVGLPRGQAGDTLWGAGLAVGSDRARFEGGTGSVLEQEPGPGVLVDSGTPVDLVVDVAPREPRLIAVPSVVDSLVLRAIGVMRARGLINVVVDSEPEREPAARREDQLAWTIATQAPDAGELVTPRTLIQLVARGLQMRPAPQLVGMSARGAQEEARVHGFSIQMDRRLSFRFTGSRVVSQQPLAGDLVPPSEMSITAEVADPIPLPVSLAGGLAGLAVLGTVVRLLWKPTPPPKREPRPRGPQAAPTYHASVEADPPELDAGADTDLVKADLTLGLTVEADPPQLTSDLDSLIKREGRHHD